MKSSKKRNSVRTVDIHDVAGHAHVSIATVSRTLNHVPTVDPTLAERVWRSVAELNYLPNTQARALVSGKSKLLGLIVSEITNPFFPELIQEFERFAVERGYEILIGSTSNDSKKMELCVRRMLERKVDGVAIMTFGFEEMVLDRFATDEVPFVTVDIPFNQPLSGVLLIDYREGIQEGVQHLVKLGHRHVGFISGPLHLHSAKARKSAFLECIRSAGLSANAAWIIEGDHTLDGGRDAMQKLLALDTWPTAIMCSNDMTAIGVQHALFEANLRVPGNFSLIGFDNIHLSEYTIPPLTTVQMSCRDLAQEAVRSLLSHLQPDKSKVETVRAITTRLVIRQTTGKPRKNERTLISARRRSGIPAGCLPEHSECPKLADQMLSLCSPRNSGLIDSCLKLLLWVVLSASWSLCAQDLRYLHHQSWSTETGLPQNSVHQIIQSSDGFIWIATEGGVARFDGVAFRVFDRSTEPAISSDDACCLANDANGDLWIGTADGLLRLHGGQFTRFTEKDGLPSASIQALGQDSGGSLVAGTRSGFATLRGDRFVPSGNLPQAFLSQSGNLMQSGKVMQNSEATVWMHSGFSVTAKAGGASRTWKVGVDLPGARIESLLIDRQGTAWVGTNNGLATLSKDSKQAMEIPELRGSTVLNTFEDREGNYWVGTETAGLHLLRAVKFRTKPELADKAIAAVVQTEPNQIWLGTKADGLRRIRSGDVEEPIQPGRLTSPVIVSLAPGANGSIWAGTPDGLNHVSKSGAVRQITSADGLPDDYIQALAAGPDDSVWAGTRHGLVHLQGDSIKTITTAEGLSGDLVGALLLTRGHELWIGTSGGLSRRTAEGKITNFTQREGLPAGIVTAMVEDADGNLWVATSAGGISRFSHGIFQTVKSATLPTNIYGMALAGPGYLWLRTNRGIQRVPIKELPACAESGQSCSLHLSHYGLADGLTSEEVVPGGSPALWRMANGELWVATRRGVGIVDPEHLAVNSAPPPVVIERFLVDDATLPADGDVLVGPGHVRYTMEYAGLSYTAPSEVRYRFMLEGLDKTWTEAGNRRTATYTNLPGRSYRFRVQAMNNDGVWNEAGASLSFRVIPPIYRRWWFTAVALLLLAAVSAGLYRLRLRRLQVQFDAVLRERNRLAREIHDTLAQDFVGVSIQLDIVSQLLGMQKVDAALDQVRQTRRIVTDGLAEARQSIWALRANVAQGSLPTRLADVVKRYASDALAIRLKIGGAFRTLDSRVESEVLRVAQEALSNVQRHSGATEAAVELRYGGDMLMLTVDDNGTGFDVEQRSDAEGRYGISGMKERAAVLGGNLEIANRPEGGTRVALSTPIPGTKE